MNLKEMVETAQLVVAPNGKPTGALLDIEIWQEIVRFLDELEEQNMVRSYMIRRQSARSPEEMGLLSWEAVQTELDTLEEANYALMD
jgi:hypothetical protein